MKHGITLYVIILFLSFHAQGESGFDGEEHKPENTQETGAENTAPADETGSKGEQNPFLDSSREAGSSSDETDDEPEEHLSDTTPVSPFSETPDEETDPGSDMSGEESLFFDDADDEAEYESPAFEGDAENFDGPDVRVDVGFFGAFTYISPRDGAPGIATSTNPGGGAALGAVFHHSKHFMSRLRVGYANLNFDVDLKNNRSPEPGETIVNITSTEELNYLTVPISAGARVGNDFFSAYTMAGVTPALLLSAGLHTRKTMHTRFENDTEVISEVISDRNIADYRQYYQIFGEIILGLEVHYGYGMIYAEGAYLRALRGVHEYPNDPFTEPARGSTLLQVVPLSLGLRFYI
ncbi:MAG: hypothetical protein ACQEQ4_04555 [Fibrobacterota bacterium]